MKISVLMALVASSEAIKINRDDTTAADIKKITESANAVAGKIDSSTDESIGSIASTAADTIREMGEKAIQEKHKQASAKNDDDEDDEEAKPEKKVKKNAHVATKSIDDDEERANKKIDEKAEENILKIEKEEAEG